MTLVKGYKVSGRNDMVLGAGTPLVHSATSLSDARGASDVYANTNFPVSPNKRQSNKRQNVTVLGRQAPSLDDLVTLSPQAKDHLNNQKSLLRRLNEGRGEIARQADQLIRDQLSQARDQVAFLHNLLQRSDPVTSEALHGSIRQVGENIARLSRHVGGSSFGGFSKGVQGLSLSHTEVNVQALSIKGEFNSVTTDENGNKVERNLSFDFSFIKVDISHTELKVVSEDSYLPTLRAIHEEYNDLAESFLAQLKN